jgi:tetratricopeptide (TPR) repeat protein
LRPSASTWRKTKARSLAIVLCFITAFPFAVHASSHPAVVKEYEQVFTTYPYSDPDPIPTMSRFYPYFRYDGFTDKPVQKKWKVVELSNDYLRILILPEIGGKIWAAVEKSTGTSFIYYNHVVKFRDVSMRGPWTSGGMEPNYGIMGHTPNCFSPVDYLVRRKADGSVSCFIGVLDLLTRSNWRLEINLPADQACFTTRSFWHNGSGLDEPYYTWMNVGIKAAGNLQFINPGTHYLGHDGRVFDWPTNRTNGRDISWYEQNDFSSYKSYHVFGTPAEFFGGYWHDEDFGMARCSDYADKPGRKIWIWGLSREGMIWEKLLTDTDGQYVEVQSGRLFNQADSSSSFTPFKHKEFPPYATDTWTEYWEPVKGTKGFVSASSWGALNVSRENNQLFIRISPSRPLHDQLEVFDGVRLLWQELITLEPMRPVEKIVKLDAEPKALKVRVGGDKLTYAAGPGEPSTRPLESPAGFDWKSTYGLYLQAKESARERDYVNASLGFENCLKTDSNYVPALVEMASLANRRADFTRAQEYARHALSIDTYDAAANYQFGLASAALGRADDAKDGFSIAGLSIGFRSAASTELARQFLREKKYDRALRCADQGLQYNALNVDALQVQAVVYRLQARPKLARNALVKLLDVDPLNHFARFEEYLLKAIRGEEFTSLIRNELPEETYLELAAWYHNVALNDEASKVLELAPPTAEVLYWMAYLRDDPVLLSRAEAASPAFVFPFRRESIPVFEWADSQRPSWRPKYFLALIRWSQGNLEQARKLFVSCGEQPDYAPFYAARSQLVEAGGLRDLARAAQLDPQQWRFGVMLARNYLKQDPGGALSVIQGYAMRFPSNDVITVLHAKTLLAASQYRAAGDLLDSATLLPCEGSTEAHSLFRESHLMLAAERFRAGKFEEALTLVATARQWPERLGSGKPYSEDLDERVEDWMEYRCLNKGKRTDEAQKALARILAFADGSSRAGIGQLASALALRQTDRAADADQILASWANRQSSSDLARWGRDVLSPEPVPLPAGIQNLEVRAFDAFLR